MSKNLVKWVCNNCGANNINHKALIYQCSICQKIASEEVISPIKDKRILDSSLEMKTLNRKLTMKERTRILFGKKDFLRFEIVIQTMKIASITASLICAAIVFYHNPFSSEDFIDNIGMMNYGSIDEGLQHITDIERAHFVEAIESANQNADEFFEIDLAGVGDSAGALSRGAGENLGQGNSNLKNKASGWSDALNNANDNLEECFADLDERASSFGKTISNNLRNIFN